MKEMSILGLVLIFLVILVIFGIFLVFWAWYHPESVLIPLNLLYNTDSSSRTNFYTSEEKETIFPVGAELEAIWQEIRREGYELYNMLENKEVNYLDNYHMNIGSEDKKQWTTIPLRLFGRDAPDYMDKCPLTSQILHQHPEIKSCLFSIMDPGKIIQPHVGPYDGLLRYQLALDIPTPINETQKCYLHVGGEEYHWTEGKGVLFDEANLHGAVNTTDRRRMVLLIDVERPYSFAPFRGLNKAVIWTMGSLSTIKP